MVWFFTRSETSFRIIKFVPPIFGKAVAWSSLGTWAVGMAVIWGRRGSARGPRWRVALFPVTAIPEAAAKGEKLWEQTFSGATS